MDYLLNLKSAEKFKIISAPEFHLNEMIILQIQHSQWPLSAKVQ